MFLAARGWHTALHQKEEINIPCCFGIIAPSNLRVKQPRAFLSRGYSIQFLTGFRIHLPNVFPPVKKLLLRSQRLIARFMV